MTLLTTDTILDYVKSNPEAAAQELTELRERVENTWFYPFTELQGKFFELECRYLKLREDYVRVIKMGVALLPSEMRATLRIEDGDKLS